MNVNEQKKVVILFTRIPKEGKTKTRLTPFLSDEESVNLHYCFMGDEIEEICKVADKVEICYFEDLKTNDEEIEDFRSFLNETIDIDFLTYEQHGDDIFEKMKNAFRESFQRNPDSKILLVGCDLPTLTSNLLVDAFNKIKEGCVYISPSFDGGYYSIGLSDFIKSPFDISSSNSIEVFDKTMASILDDEKIVQVGPKIQDIDDKNDLFALWRNRANLDPNSLTRAFLENFDEDRFINCIDLDLKVSVIVPIYNEISTIEKFYEGLKPYFSQAEIIFVDGGSNDGTQQFLQKRVKGEQKLIVSAKGRAGQMNAGARAATGDAYLFLHADSKPPKNMIGEVRRVLMKANWGCFGVKFSDKDPLMKICQIISNNRILDRRVVFGDQGIFIRKELFEEVGGFPDIPIMEDYQLSLTLKDKGERIGIAKGLIETSSRRYYEGGKLKVMWKMNRLRKAYRDGIDPEIIAEAYKDVR